MPPVRHDDRPPPRPRSGRLLTAALALALAAVPLAAVPGAAAADTADAPELPELALPAPTGGLPVGRTDLHLVDADREDLWVGGPRELMATLWYPARSDAGRTAAYITEGEALSWTRELGLPEEYAHALHRVGVHSRTDAAPSRPDGDGYPLVLVSPGAGHNAMLYSAVAEDLASHGFVVAGIDHAYEAGPVEFPDGRILECDACGQERWAEGAVQRGADVSFLLDRLTGADGADPAWRWSEVVDASRVGMAGHSWGGAAAAEALRAEERVDAGINYDGPYYPPALDTGTDKPLALLQRDFDVSEEWETGYREFWPRLTGWRQWIRVTGGGHSNSVDQGLLTEQLGLRDMFPPDDWRRRYGDLGTEHGLDLTRAYTLAFFDHHLRGADPGLLEDPAAVHPELVVVDP
ncbi:MULTISPECIES: acetylhydrolase [unclassified Nocardiopsis]|uniref:alpha/beta hydrolase n=1 Tax=Nocardiopsis TaxID=2013 RepID=UPI00387B22C1